MRVALSVLLLASSSLTFAEGETVGSWTLSDIGLGYIASTRSDTGGTFGLMCIKDPGDCQYFFNPQLQCTEDSHQPLLFNGEAGALASNSLCVHIGESKLLAVSDSLDEMVFGSSYIGIAIAMEGGKFKVMRFSTSGAIPIIAKARKLTAEGKVTKPDNPEKKMSH